MKSTDIRISANFSPAEVRVLKRAMDSFSESLVQTNLFQKGSDEEKAAYFRLKSKIVTWNSRLPKRRSPK